VLILAWILLGIGLLAIEAGLLTLGAQPGQYVSIIGALRFDLLGAHKIPFSTWPWGAESIAGSIASGAEETILGTGGGAVSAVSNVATAGSTGLLQSLIGALP
jgi:hypothetical protein